MTKAFVNGVEVVIYDFQENKAKCFIPELGIENWYRFDQIEVRYDKN